MFNAVTYKDGVTHRQRMRRGAPLVHPPPQRGTSGLSNPFLGVFFCFEGTQVEVPPPLPQALPGGESLRCSSCSFGHTLASHSEPCVPIAPARPQFAAGGVVGTDQPW